MLENRYIIGVTRVARRHVSRTVIAVRRNMHSRFIEKGPHIQRMVLGRNRFDCRFRDGLIDFTRNQRAFEVISL